jgi:hypothetical protein
MSQFIYDKKHIDSQKIYNYFTQNYKILNEHLASKVISIMEKDIKIRSKNKNAGSYSYSLNISLNHIWYLEKISPLLANKLKELPYKDYNMEIIFKIIFWDKFHYVFIFRAEIDEDFENEENFTWKIETTKNYFIECLSNLFEYNPDTKIHITNSGNFSYTELQTPSENVLKIFPEW